MLNLKMIGNQVIVFGIAAIFLSVCDGAVLPGVLPGSGVECHCYNNAATARMVSPVCGTDGQTYQNMCVFVCYQKEYEDLDLKHKGECLENYETFEDSEESAEDCYCTKEINPVCGTDNKTYKNTCYLNCRASYTKDLKLKHHGSCDDSQLSEASDNALIDCPCTREINPVCGSDAKTYPNFCILNCHSNHFKDLKLKHHGECGSYTGKEISELEVEDCSCSKEINHVCGTDSKTYQNLCILNCHSRDTKDLKMKHHGACETSGVGSTKDKTSINCFCSKEINHVCGTDSKTYQNLCILNCHSRDTKDLKLSHMGHCVEK